MKTVLAIAGGAFLVVLLIAGSLVYKFLTKDRPRVVSGADNFSKQVFCRDPSLGAVTDIKPTQPDELLIAGQSGADFLTHQGSVTKSLQFERCLSNVTVVEAGRNFLCRGAWTVPAKLYDSAGKTLWSYNDDNGVDDAASGFFGASHEMSVVVGLNGSGGVHLLDFEGKERWREEDGNVWHVEIAAIGNGPDNVIMHSNAGGALTTRDASGKVLAQYTPEIYLSQFSLTAWNDDTHVNKVITARDGSIYIMTAKAKTLARLPAPGYIGISDAKGTPVRFISGQPYYASLLGFYSHALLYIHNHQNKVVYHEVLGDKCGAVHAVAGKNDAEELLVGCDGVVWKYSATNQLLGPK